MRNIKMTLAFEGSRYHGWQVQKNARSVTETVQDAMQTLFGSREDIKGCSRTDAGVHANGYVFSFFTESDLPTYAMKRSLNALLPDDIGVLHCEEVPDDFHARYSAVGKRYVYLIHNADGKNPFYRDRALWYWKTLDLPVLQRACALFVGRHDFSGFCSSKSDLDDHTRTIYRCEVNKQEHLVTFLVEGDGFLYNMVRRMVGALIRLDEGKITQEQIASALFHRTQTFAGYTAPACGLYLDKVFYEKPAHWR